MAIVYNNFNQNTLMSFAKSFAALNGQPLDQREIYTSKEALEAAATGTTTYVGQTLKLINSDGSVDSYIIKNEQGELEKLQLESKFQEEFKDFLDNSYITLQEDTTNANYSILKFTKRGAQYN
jgi:hypothetical protein